MPNGLPVHFKRPSGGYPLHTGYSAFASGHPLGDITSPRVAPATRISARRQPQQPRAGRRTRRLLNDVRLQRQRVAWRARRRAAERLHRQLKHFACPLGTEPYGRALVARVPGQASSLAHLKNGTLSAFVTQESVMPCRGSVEWLNYFP
ncbi:hypothetical protein EXIGLDRAFT_494112 [Exidia glandulosa HHB12029]|uniref:Uncharacterized protein n=1 Tax=Exidia glandulosa HHB12029 TaxID=1314781 RepID=A0A165JIZ3_EXIGL|nr:hypothetical protein EXIGLDRAFT_494112 [Exidia glandulosa HHB12029]